MLLDRTKPYSEVHGLPGAAYEQNGNIYRSNGTIATPTPYVEEVIIKDDSIPPPIHVYEQTTEKNAVHEDKTIEDMHWKHLKALIESFGGEWTDRKSAIEFMKGKN